MDLTKMVQIATDVSIAIRRGEWISFSHRDGLGGPWVYDGFCVCSMSGYVLDFCALELRNAEAFILALSAITTDDINTFDDAAVRRVIRQANLDWEFVD